MIDALACAHAISIPLLTESFRGVLLQEAQSYNYRRARPSIGKGEKRVRQRMGVFNDLPAHSAFWTLTARFQSLWDETFADLRPSPFSQRPIFNDVMLQKYDTGHEGITPHMDRTAYRYIICLFVLAGRGRFCVCADRGGRDVREIPNAPGDVILTRAPGFLGSDVRPFHFVEDIRETRYVFGLRHDATRVEG